MSGSIGVQGHFANGLAALFLACGQDAACVAEAAVGVTRFEGETMAGCIRRPRCANLIVGTVAGETRLPSQKACLDILDSRVPATLARSPSGRRSGRLGGGAVDHRRPTAGHFTRRIRSWPVARRAVRMKRGSLSRGAFPLEGPAAGRSFSASALSFSRSFAAGRWCRRWSLLRLFRDVLLSSFTFASATVPVLRRRRPLSPFDRSREGSCRLPSCVVGVGGRAFSSHGRPLEPSRSVLAVFALMTGEFFAPAG